jgi:hypothetical protein
MFSSFSNIGGGVIQKAKFSVSTSSTSSIPYSNDLVQFYKFNTGDVSTNGKYIFNYAPNNYGWKNNMINRSLAGNAADCLTTSFVKSGNASMNASTNAYMEINNPPTTLFGDGNFTYSKLSTGGFTLSVWLYRTINESNTSNLFSLYNGSNNYLFRIGYNTENGGNQITYNGSILITTINSGSGSSTVISSPRIIPSNTWTFIAFTVSGSFVSSGTGFCSLYVNGKVDPSINNVNVNYPYNNNNTGCLEMKIGFHQNGCLFGYIDQMMVFNKAINSYDISSLIYTYLS